MIELVVIALILLGLGYFVFSRWINKSQAAAESDAELVLDETFDGRPDVAFTIHLRTMKYETAVLGAKKRGYKLVHQTGDPNGLQKLIFEKISD